METLPERGFQMAERQRDFIHDLVQHVVSTPYESVSPRAIQATKTYVLDSLGVAAVGTLAPGVKEMLSILRGWGGSEQSTALVLGGMLPPPSAAMLNSFLMHNQEFDCIHDRAVLHPFTVVLPVSLSVAEAKGNVTARDLLTAVCLGVDVTCYLGLASRSAMTHFRPGTAGAFGAVAAAGKILGFGETTLANAMGIVYSQISGTLQPHHEGVTVNSMQTAFNARAAVTAVSLAAEGIEGPTDVLEGRYGYLRLFEGEYSLEDAEDLGRVWQVEQVGHKPYPCGRLTQGTVEAALALRESQGIDAEDVAECEATVPPLVDRLVGRPLDRSSPTAQYAKLSLPFVVATALVRGSVFVTDFQGDALRDQKVHELAHRIAVLRAPDIYDENVMYPARLRIRMRNGAVHEAAVERALGHPDNPLSREQHLAKFHRCWDTGASHLPAANSRLLIDLVDRLEDVATVRELVQTLRP